MRTQTRKWNPDAGAPALVSPGQSVEAKHTRDTGERGRQSPLGQELCREQGRVHRAAPHCRPWVSHRGGRTTAWPAPALQEHQGCMAPLPGLDAAMGPSTAVPRAARGLTFLPGGRGPGRKPCLSPGSGSTPNIHPPWILWRHGHPDVTSQVWAQGRRGARLVGSEGGGNEEGGEGGEHLPLSRRCREPVTSAPFSFWSGLGNRVGRCQAHKP